MKLLSGSSAVFIASAPLNQATCFFSAFSQLLWNNSSVYGLLSRPAFVMIIIKKLTHTHSLLIYSADMWRSTKESCLLWPLVMKKKKHWCVRISQFIQSSACNLWPLSPRSSRSNDAVSQCQSSGEKQLAQTHTQRDTTREEEQEGGGEEEERRRSWVREREQGVTPQPTHTFFHCGLRHFNPQWNNLTDQ